MSTVNVIVTTAALGKPKTFLGFRVTTEGSNKDAIAGALRYALPALKGRWLCANVLPHEPAVEDGYEAVYDVEAETGAWSKLRASERVEVEEVYRGMKVGHRNVNENVYRMKA